MSNATAPQYRIEKIGAPRSCRIAATQQRGYNDAMAGLPFAADYDMWSEGRQRNYEIGRAAVAAIRSAGINPPTWPASRTFLSVLKRIPVAVAAESAERSYHIHVPR